ncbi:MAG TPA: bifunctional DNA primase/polymerase, partial [Acidimicrobiales bacterium]
MTATADKAEQLLDQLHDGIAELTSSDAWTAWLDVARTFHTYRTGGSDISEVGELELTRSVVAECMARSGWPVLPCHHPENGACSCGAIGCPSAGKHPRTRRGLLDATTDPVVVRRWWRAWPDANVAVRTGARPTGAGVVVIDIDDGGETSLDELVSQHGPLPRTLEAETGGGGRHLYFAHPGGPVPNSAGRLGDGLDVRADGGYVLVAPSRHRSGRHYDWKCAPIAKMPNWLSRLVQPVEHEPAMTPRRVRRHVSAWAEAAVADEVSAVRASVEGRRNHTLNRAAFKLGQLVGAGYLDAADVEDRLAQASVAVGLTAREIRATIASGLRAGMA